VELLGIFSRLLSTAWSARRSDVIPHPTPPMDIRTELIVSFGQEMKEIYWKWEKFRFHALKFVL
jgi:hypothetical protein